MEEQIENKTDKLLYTAKKSAWQYVGKRGGLLVLDILILAILIVFAIESPLIWVGVALLLIINAIVIACAVIYARNYELRFYGNKVVEKYGIFSTHEKSSVLTPILGVSISQSFWGKIFNYGSIDIDVVGKKWDITTTHIKAPYEFKEFLEKFIDNTDYDKVKMFVSQ